MSDRAGGLASSMAHSTRMEQKSVWVILLVLLVLLAGIGLLVLLMQAWSWIAGLAACSWRAGSTGCLSGVHRSTRISNPETSPSGTCRVPQANWPGTRTGRRISGSQGGRCRVSSSETCTSLRYTTRSKMNPAMIFNTSHMGLFLGCLRSKTAPIRVPVAAQDLVEQFAEC